MRIITKRGIRNLSFEIEVYDNIQEIKALVLRHDDFHDGELFGIDFDSDKRTAHISLAYTGKNYWFEFDGVSMFNIAMDTKVNYISELVIEKIPEGVRIDFGACGLIIEAHTMIVKRLHK